jgi:hypothetical protein
MTAEKPRWNTVADASLNRFLGHAGPYDLWWDDKSPLCLAVVRRGGRMIDYDWFTVKNGHLPEKRVVGDPGKYDPHLPTFDQWPAILQVLKDNNLWKEN